MVSYLTPSHGKLSNPQPRVSYLIPSYGKTSYKYLGVTVTEKLDWSKTTQLLVKKGQQRLLYANFTKLQSGQGNSTTFPPCTCRNCTDMLHHLLGYVGFSADNNKQNEAAASDFSILKNSWD